MLAMKNAHFLFCSLATFISRSTRTKSFHFSDIKKKRFFFIRKKTKHSLINIGSGIEKNIEQYARFIMKKLKVSLEIKKDISKPNGTPRKILNSKLAKSYGWKSKINLDNGFNLTYKHFLENS